MGQEGDAAPVAPAFAVNAVHMLRTASQAHVHLSQLADQKASILMGATFVVFTISVGQSSRGQFPVALSVLAISAFLSAVFAVAAVMPSIRPPKRVEAGENLLFFGVFTHYEEEEFADRLLRKMQDEEQMYRTMMRDLHQNGRILQRKYRYLGLAYRVFVLGLVVTLAIFLVESWPVVFGLA